MKKFRITKVRHMSYGIDVVIEAANEREAWDKYDEMDAEGAFDQMWDKELDNADITSEDGYIKEV